MAEDFLSEEQLEKDLKEDFGSGWAKFDKGAQKQLIDNRRRLLLKKYKKFGSMGEEVGRIRRDQSQMYIGIMLGLSGGLIGEVVDGWFGEYVIYDWIVVGVFVLLVGTVHFAYDSLISDMFNFTLKHNIKKEKK